MAKKTEEEDGFRYRLNVAAILQNGAGKILIGERKDRDGAWQFPQGGVDDGETLEQALLRELEEEISVKPHFCRIVEQNGPYLYVFGDGKIVKGFHGKKQHYFRVAYTGDDAGIDVRTAHPEFQATRWVEPAEFEIAWLPRMKRDMYRAVFQDFFGLQL